MGCWAGCVYSSKSIERFELAFQKLLSEIEAEFVRNMKGLVDFEVRTWITKKSLVDAEASPLIHASIHRSLVSPTACLQYIRSSSYAEVHLLIPSKLNAEPWTESKFVNLLRNPGIDSQPGGFARQPYLTHHPPAYVPWQAGTICQIGLSCGTGPPGWKSIPGLLIRFKNTGSELGPSVTANWRTGNWDYAAPPFLPWIPVPPF